MQVKKVLVINTIGFLFEGISSVVVNYISNMERNGLEFDFITQPDVRNDFKKILIPLGNIIVVPDRKQNISGYIAGLSKVLKWNHYDVIHIHGNSGTMAIEAFLAKLHHVNKIIVHSHNTECDHPLVNRVLTPAMKILATDLLACSNAAGNWLYGKQRFIVLNNAIDTERFRFNQQVRDECRKEFGLADEFVIGHIGNFVEQKNHEFLIDIFIEYHKNNPNSKLLLGSDGPKFEEMKRKVSEYNLSDSVIFAGRRSDVERLYSAMDVFVFPSKWEGLGIVLIEAQVNGLICYTSEKVPREADISGLTTYLNLRDPATVWAKRILNCGKSNRQSLSDTNLKNAELHNFNIRTEANRLRDIYL